MEIYNSKIFGWLKFAEYMSIHQLHQNFLALKFHFVRYNIFILYLAVTKLELTSLWHISNFIFLKEAMHPSYYEQDLFGYNIATKRKHTVAS